MKPIRKGRYSLRAGAGPDDLADARALRTSCFGPPGGAHDAFDDSATHVLIHDRPSGALVCTYRLGHAPIGASYAAQFYDLSALAALDGPMLELGRFCVHPAWHDPDILRLAWAGMTGVVDTRGVVMLFGCASFPGVAVDPHRDAFALLRARHLGPAHLRPAIRADEVFRFDDLPAGLPDPRRASAALPPLLRTYLTMGGWVSDHAVIDRDMGTLHVFTGLEIARIPEGRKRLLRALIADPIDHSPAPE